MKNIPKEEKRKIINRLKRAEGQIRGIERLIEDDASLEKIVVQMRAVKSALSAVGWTLFDYEMSIDKNSDVSPDSQVDQIKKTISQLTKLCH